ncbi:MAG: RNase adapter RapZ, partial [Thiobacillus sp.]|nr:RNase adapter RapZ [Thiobacillus sp.]
MQIVLVSGLSGSGKSIAIAVLEDIGYYCVDNLPLAMLQPLVDYLKGAGHARIAIAIDARSSASFSQ